MDFIKLAEKRISCRSYDSKKEVLRDDIIEILRAGTYAPSACNSQPWRFVVCEKENAKKISSYIIREDLKINHWTVDVPVFVIVCEEKVTLMKSLNAEDQQHYAQIDIGSAATSICLAATDKGLGSCIIGVFDETKIKALLNIPNEVVIRAVVAVGYPKSDNVGTKGRKPECEKISFNKW